ncbi:hypothetical protein JOQ06_002354 [Pogonophryne albipinna]|uniref:Uncharacterized protein n=1 Tax=Pogonophryne albipinna TaxID=1090488 RepID=A0AAD6B8T1_9TELE|nr:hypothetical protein JOQ06_002354 [Pogonophryne albipinna]
MKGNIPSNVPPSSPLLPSATAPSSLSPLQPLNLYSQAAHHAGPSVESRKPGWELGAFCLQAKNERVKTSSRSTFPASSCLKAAPFSHQGLELTLAAVGWFFVVVI